MQLFLFIIPSLAFQNSFVKDKSNSCKRNTIHK